MESLAPVKKSWFIPLQFTKEVISELKKVTWPTRAETIKMTATVILLSAAVGLFVGGLDYAFVQLTGILLRR